LSPTSNPNFFDVNTTNTANGQRSGAGASPTNDFTSEGNEDMLTDSANETDAIGYQVQDDWPTT